MNKDMDSNPNIFMSTDAQNPGITDQDFYVNCTYLQQVTLVKMGFFFFVFLVNPWDVWNHPTSHCDDVICSDMQSMLHFELDLTSRANITDLDYVSCKTRQLLKLDFSECSFQPSGIGLILSKNLALGIHISLCLTDILQSSPNPLDLLRLGF